MAKKAAKKVAGQQKLPEPKGAGPGENPGPVADEKVIDEEIQVDPAKVAAVAQVFGDDPDQHPLELKTSAPQMENEVADLAAAQEETEQFEKETIGEPVQVHAFITKMKPSEMKVVPEWKALVPRLAPDQREALKQNIVTHGLLDAFKCTIDGRVIDGMTRHEILTELGNDEPQAVLVLDIAEDQVPYWVMALNAHRRQMTVGQRAILAVAMLKEQKKLAAIRQEKARQRGLAKANASPSAPPAGDAGSTEQPAAHPPETPPEVHGRAAEIVAHDTGLSHTTITDAQAVVEAAEAGDKDAQADVEKIKTGEISVKKAARKVRERRKLAAAGEDEVFLEVPSINRKVQQLAGQLAEWSKPFEGHLTKEERVTIAKAHDLLQDISNDIFPIEKRLSTKKVPANQQFCINCGKAFKPSELQADTDGDLWCKACAEGDDPDVPCVDCDEVKADPKACEECPFKDAL